MALRDPYTLRSVELRSLLGVAAPTLSDIYRKLNIAHAPATGPQRGASRLISGHDVHRVLEARGYEYPATAEVLAFLMCKGGVGKTTSTLFVSQRLSAYGARVLAIDADSQGNLTSALHLEQFGFGIDGGTPILVDVVSGQCGIEDAIVELTPTLHILPSTPLNATLEGRIRECFKNPSLPVRKAIEPIASRYDYVLIDCAPALSLTNAAIVSAAGTVVLPVSPDKFSQLGLEQTLTEIQQLERDFSFEVRKRILFTRFDGREFTSLKYLTEIASNYDEHMRFATAVRTCADVKNVITRREDLFALRRSNAKEDYDALTREIMGLDEALARKPRAAARQAAG